MKRREDKRMLQNNRTRRSANLVRFSLLMTVLVLFGSWSFPVQARSDPSEIVRTRYLKRWGIQALAGLTYSVELGGFILLEKTSSSR